MTPKKKNLKNREEITSKTPPTQFKEKQGRTKDEPHNTEAITTIEQIELEQLHKFLIILTDVDSYFHFIPF